ncbi:hypothetical protein [Desulforhopalus singaporensis]|nr:hypothetical protein [Desulforhopalus singaporensis]
MQDKLSRVWAMRVARPHRGDFSFRVLKPTGGKEKNRVRRSTLLWFNV